MYFFGSDYFLLVFIPTILISLAVQLYLKSTYSKWSQVRNGINMTGVQVGQQLIRSAGLTPLPFQRVQGTMSDHFDPTANVVRLSDGVAMQPSVAAMAITAHELGHVQQYQTGSALITARNFLLPAVQFSPMISYIAIVVGLFLNMTGLIYIGILFFGLMVLFTILTLPVEFDASRRGLAMLDEAGLMHNPDDASGARAVLRAAALTYVAAAVTAVLQLMYYLSLVNRRR
jgi:uncharacterized protein